MKNCSSQLGSEAGKDLKGAVFHLVDDCSSCITQHTHTYAHARIAAAKPGNIVANSGPVTIIGIAAPNTIGVAANKTRAPDRIAAP